jgi:hypothetical protein
VTELNNPQKLVYGGAFCEDYAPIGVGMERVMQEALFEGVETSPSVVLQQREADPQDGRPN